MKKKRRWQRVQRELIVGDIDGELLKKLYAIPDSVDLIDLHVCSGGGSFYSAVAAVEILKRWIRQKRTVRTVALGEVCSSAVLLVAAGSPGQRYSYRSTLWGLHRPFTSGDAIEDAGIQQSEAQLLQTMETQCVELLSELTGMTCRWWRDLLSQPGMVWRNGQLAKQMGLVDHVVNDDANTPV